MTILQRTTNFFELYQHVCGISEVPPTYHFWSAVSLLAATVENRIWFEKFAHEKLYPQLYIIMVGPSGLGKGTAISHALKLADRSISMNKFRGRLTGAHLIDHLGKPHIDADGIANFINPRLWLIMDELKNDVSTNKKLVEDFLYLMTEIYTASNYTIQTGTRTYGQVNLECPLINWLAGTTEDDLKWVITRELLNSGFTARTCFIFGEYNFNKRITRIKYPEDYNEVFEHLSFRLLALQNTSGRMLITPTAEAEVDKWYLTRPNPEDELMASAWKRQHDLLLKCAMILCLADGKDLIIKHLHVLRAKQMIGLLYKNSERLIEISSVNNYTKPAYDVLDYLKQFESVSHTKLSRLLRTKRGMTAQQFRRAMAELESMGLAETFTIGASRAINYRYRSDESEVNA